MSDLSDLTVKMVHCCVCNGSGKVPRFLWLEKDCSVCEGVGQRKIFIARNLSPADRAWVIDSAVTGSLNYYPLRPFDQISNSAIHWNYGPPR